MTRPRAAGTTSQRASTNDSIDSTAPLRLNASAPSNGLLERAHEGLRDVPHVLKVLPAAVADPVRTAHGHRLDRLGRLAGHPEVATDAIDRPGTQADAGDPVIEPVDPGIQLVADLVRAIMGQRGEPHLVGDRSSVRSAGPCTAAELAYTTLLTRSLSARAASKTASVPMTFTRAPRIGLARQVGVCKPARCRMWVAPHRPDGRADRVGLGDVARNEVDLRRLLRFQDEIEPVRVFLQVVDPDLAARIDEPLGDPGADASVTARHEDPRLPSAQLRCEVASRTLFTSPMAVPRRPA